MPNCTTTKLERISWLSRQNPEKKFTNLIHLFNKESLHEHFHKLNGKKAVGVDGIKKADYQQGLDSNLEDLVARMKTMSYTPGPVRKVEIPKDGKGSFRPLGISNTEDKIVQSMMASVLESIFEPNFYDFSYGFRRGRNCHDAVGDLLRYILYNPVQCVLDLDIENFFGSIPHDLITSVINKRIGDKKLLRYVARMLKSGILSDGELTVSETGVPQGSICSPIIANAVAHYVLDDWFESVVKTHCRGKVAMFRYCDDLVICCQNAVDGERVRRAMIKRLEKYGMKANAEKTKLIPFSKKRANERQRQGTFDFLGFTFYLGLSQKGRHTPRVKTSGKRFRSKLKKLNQWMKDNRSRYRQDDIWRRLKLSLSGHFNYYGVSLNVNSLVRFKRMALKIVFKWLNRRSQKRSMTWSQFALYIESHPLPSPKVYRQLFT